MDIPLLSKEEVIINDEIPKEILEQISEEWRLKK
jgi:hypothetical protein